MENGRSGIEARLIVLDNSGAGAYATIPGRCWPGWLTGWLVAENALFLSLSLSLIFSFSFSVSSLATPQTSSTFAPSSLSFVATLFSRTSALHPFRHSATLIPRYIMHFYISFTLSTCRFIFRNDATLSRFSLSPLPHFIPFAFSVGLAWPLACTGAMSHSLRLCPCRVSCAAILNGIISMS